MKLKILFLFLFISLLNSCAVLKIKPLTCEEYFHEIVLKDKKIPSKFSFNGKIYIANQNLFIKGTFKNEDEGKIKLYLPFGLFAGEIKIQDDKYCFKINKEEGCIKNIFNLSSIFDIDIPIQNIISGKFNLKGTEKFYCGNKKLYVKKAGYTIIYDFENTRDRTKFLPKKVVYKNYSVEYLYNVENKLKIIEIFSNNERILKIEILKFKKL